MKGSSFQPPVPDGLSKARRRIDVCRRDRSSRVEEVSLQEWT